MAYMIDTLAKLCAKLFLCCLVVVVLSNFKDLFNFTLVSRRMYFNFPQFSSKVDAANVGICSHIPGKVDLRIIVIAFNRPESLIRLLHSLNYAFYYGDSIRLEVWIDRHADDDSIDDRTVNASNMFDFRHGSYAVCSYSSHVGVYGQWLSTWKPLQNNSEIAVILEDDLTVSPFFYKYLKSVHTKYVNYQHINGFTLQGISIKHSGSGSQLLQCPEHEKVFLYPVVGTWGYSPSKKNWLKFLEWYETISQNKRFHRFYPLIPGNVASSWYQTFLTEGKADGMWSIWYIFYAWKNGEYTLYPNFKGHQGLTANWGEKGLHFTGKNAIASNPLLSNWKESYEHLPDEPIKLDIYGNIVDK